MIIFWIIAVFIICFSWTFSIIIYKKEKIEDEKKEEERIKNIMKSHNYVEEEYIELYNYCVNIRNSFLDERYSIFRNKRIERWDIVLNECKIIHNQSYYTPNYSDLCFDLLVLLWEEGYSIKQINYGMLNNDYDT